MFVEAFGPLSLVDDFGTRLSIGGGRQRTAFAVMCLTPGEIVPQDMLTTALWGEAVPNRYSRSLSTYMSNLRRQLGVGIEFDTNGYRLNLDRDRVSTARFADSIRQANSDSGVLRSALDLWVGEPFADLDGHGLFRDERRRLREARLSAVREVARAEIDAGKEDLAIRRLGELFGDFPYDEQLRGLHMEALFRSGRQAEAIRSFATFRQLLVEELGIEPSAALRDLELAMLNQDLPDRQRSAIEPAARSSLPRRYSSLVGREAELKMVRERFERSRLVSLIGPGGIGKSTIGVEVARALSTARDVALVSLEDLSAGDVSTEAARSMGLEPGPGIDPVDVIQGYTESRPHLIVMDGCEAHIDEVASFVDRVLSMTDCSVLATSREVLGLTGESAVRIDPLPIDAAVELFLVRAEIMAPSNDSLQSVRRVCEAVDSIPLAVELAASRCRSLPLDRLVERIEEQMPLLRRSRSSAGRHHSIVTALDWSFDLLDPSEQETLVAISIFRTPFRISDVAALLDDSSREDVVVRLVEVSLVQPPNHLGEYRLLEPIRQYARRALEQRGQAADVQERHLAWVVESSRRAGAEQWTANILEVRRWIFDKRYEMKAAIDFAEETDNPDAILAIIGALGRRLTNFGISGPFLESSLRAIDHPDATRNSDWMRASANVGFMLARDGQWDEAETFVRRGLARATEIDCPPEVHADMLQRLATVVGHGGTTPETFRLIDEATALVEEGSPSQGMWLYNKALLLVQDDRIDEGAAVIERGRQWWGSEIGNPWWGYHAVMSDVLEFKGRLEEALASAELAATLAEGERMYLHASNSWDNAVHIAARINANERLRAAATRRRQLREITGEPSYLPTEIALAHVENRHGDVITLSKEWFAARSTDPAADIGQLSGDEVRDVYGRSNVMPPIFSILRFIATALHTSGNHDPACRIAHSIPSLIAESRFEYWTEVREEGQWQDLIERCPNPGSHFEPLRLEKLLGYTQQALADHKPARDAP